MFISFCIIAYLVSSSHCFYGTCLLACLWFKKSCIRTSTAALSELYFMCSTFSRITVIALCLPDNLFGTCSGIGHSSLPSGYRYQLNGQQLAELESILRQLVTGGFTWHHVYTQCILAQSLSAYRQGLLLGNDVSVCQGSLSRKLGTYEQQSYLPSHDKSSTIPKYSKSSVQHKFGYDQDAWPNTTISSFSSSSYDQHLDTQARRLIQDAYEEFNRFVKELSAEDLRDLKQFLLEESLNMKAESLQSLPDRLEGTIFHLPYFQVG
jgi:hypothetical protein